ncbi:hypothetical protein RND81_05G024200 [Saponaria officinalis]|uniref:Uncharacterized protein n=1 Tax=Saponaria officinalis TaxID=3572 RepID=A0AAW1KTH5_SAPOF
MGLPFISPNPFSLPLWYPIPFAHSLPSHHHTPPYIINTHLQPTSANTSRHHYHRCGYPPPVTPPPTCYRQLPPTHLSLSIRNPYHNAHKHLTNSNPLSHPPKH